MATHLPVTSWGPRLTLGAAILTAALAGAGMVVTWEQKAAPVAPLPEAAAEPAAEPAPARLAGHGRPPAVAMPYFAPLAPAAAAAAPRGLSERYPRHSGR